MNRNPAFLNDMAAPPPPPPPALTCHHALMPAAARAGFDDWLAGRRDLASFVPEPWRVAPAVADAIASDAWRALDERLRTEYAETAAERRPIYPPFHQLFEPLRLCASPAACRVVLPGAMPDIWGASHGLAYSVRAGSSLSDVLRNMLVVRDECVREGERGGALARMMVGVKQRRGRGDAGAGTGTGAGAREDEPKRRRKDDEDEGGSESDEDEDEAPSPPPPPQPHDPLVSRGCLESWAKQGVLLVNARFTVRRSEYESHADLGWAQFATACCRAALSTPGCVALLLGRAASNLALDAARDAGARVVSTSSPHSKVWEGYSDESKARKFSSGFKYSRAFAVANGALVVAGREPVSW